MFLFRLCVARLTCAYTLAIQSSRLINTQCERTTSASPYGVLACAYEMIVHVYARSVKTTHYVFVVKSSSWKELST